SRGILPDDRHPLVGDPGGGFAPAERTGREQRAAAHEQLPPGQRGMTRRGKEREARLRIHSALCVVMRGQRSFPYRNGYLEGTRPRRRDSKSARGPGLPLGSRVITTCF